MLYFIFPDLLQAILQFPKLWGFFHKRLLSDILQSFPHLLSVNASKAKNANSGQNFSLADGSLSLGALGFQTNVIEAWGKS